MRPDHGGLCQRPGIIHLIGIISLFLALPTWAAGCLPYEPGIVTLSGTIEKHVAFGPPGFGETPKIDTREDFTGLRLEHPVCTIPGDTDQHGERLVRMMQMVFYDGYSKLQIGYKVTVTGTLEHSTTGHHHTTVLIQVKGFQ